MVDMYYYKVLVSSQRYRGSEPLTYSFDEVIKPGQLVEVPLQNKQTGGVVVEATGKPSFKLKPITRTTIDKPLPATSLELMDWLANTTLPHKVILPPNLFLLDYCKYLESQKIPRLRLSTHPHYLS